MKTYGSKTARSGVADMGSVIIYSHSSESFADRIEAGRLLGDTLIKLGISGDVVLGIPRGGVVVANELAWRLNAALDVALAHKLSAPGNPELAIGAVAEDGEAFIQEDYAERSGANSKYLQMQTERLAGQLDKRRMSYREVRQKISLAGRAVIVTDDGVATGATMKAVLWSVRRQNPRRLICALPVGPPDTLAELSDSADQLICLRAPANFGAVGQFYRQFDQTDETQVLHILAVEAGRIRGQP